MKLTSSAGIFISLCLLGHDASGETLQDVISEGRRQNYLTSETVVFPVTEKTTTLDPRGYEFSRFLVNHVRIDETGHAELFYAKEDVMPPCIFVHAPACPQSKRICDAKSMRSLRAMLGREHEKDDAFSRWSFFVIEGDDVRVVHIRVGRKKGGDIGGIATFEATAKVSEFKFRSEVDDRGSVRQMQR